MSTTNVWPKTERVLTDRTPRVQAHSARARPQRRVPEHPSRGKHIPARHVSKSPLTLLAPCWQGDEANVPSGRNQRRATDDFIFDFTPRQLDRPRRLAFSVFRFFDTRLHATRLSIWPSSQRSWLRTRPSRRTAWTVSSSSSAELSIAVPQARIGSRRRHLPTCCKRGILFRHRLLPVSAVICRGRSQRRSLKTSMTVPRDAFFSFRRGRGCSGSMTARSPSVSRGCCWSGPA
jgi:hypothetical protein